LVTSLDIENNKIEYSSGVDAPNLFSDGDANGKTPFPAQNITFIKEGDTYTIKSISGSDGVEVDSLNEFEHLTGYSDGKGGSFSIYTNSFWPLDGVTYDERDLMFGDVGSYRNSYKNYITSSTKGLALPISDDSLAHNSYFGMEYAVQFTLSADYVGPLNYYFFGDDDMWVFLNNELVCDIGGVHSSVGEYVDLWDYIEQGTSGTYTLSFYYTERGASGSSCYMRFTLPSVTDATLVQGTGSLKVEKEVSGTGADSRTPFSFSLGLTDSNNNTLKDTYGYRIYNSDNTESSTGTITNNGTFQLTDGQYIIVSYLPVGTICTVKETTSGYVTTYTVGSGTSETGTSAEVTIEENETVTIHFLNTREFTLPESGGSGVWMFASMGVALCGATGVVFYRRRRRV
ncbi:MAG: fibro-slime domain-containing protein, partial [Clostridiales bacterium]|nr:fibro-slime domain-containing protein [Clostridiales bacterium]